MLGNVIWLLFYLPGIAVSQHWMTSHKSFFELTPAPVRPGEINQGFSRGLTDFSNDEIEAIVESHNEYRRNTRPEGANLRYMMGWKTRYHGSRLADRCNFEHGGFEPNISPFESVGQNLYVASEGSTNAESGVVATEKWHDEEEFYDYHTGSCTSVCGHYTQVVWARTYTVGCGRRRCGRVSNVFFNDPSYIIVCNYGPAGNCQGEAPFTLGPRCSDCDKEAGFCFNSLCRDCSGANFVNGCECNLECQNCGTLDETTCTCACAPGWDGGDCSKRCDDHHHWCNTSPGWPGPDFCDFSPEVPRFCRQMCGVCSSPDPNFKCGASGGGGTGGGEGGGSNADSNTTCEDSNANCYAWSEYCDNNDWVRENCQKTCNNCPVKGGQGELDGGKDGGQTGTDGQTGSNGQQPDPDCEDGDDGCESWANSGHCESSEWVRDNCPKSCKTCQSVAEPTSVATSCEDSNTDCPYWAEIGECDNNPEWMSENCPLSCGVCKSGETGREPTTVKPVAPKTTAPANPDEGVGEGTNEACEDSNPDCYAWTEYCDNNDWVRENCQKTCNPKCQSESDGTDQESTTVKPVAPTTTAPTNPNPGDNGGCENKDSNCIFYDEHCESSEWVRENCPKTCNPTCHTEPTEQEPTTVRPVAPTTTAPTNPNQGGGGGNNPNQGGGDCDNNDENCPFYEEYCDSSEWVQENCPKTCNTCPGGKTGGETVTKKPSPGGESSLPYCNVEFTAVAVINGELHCFQADKLWRFARVRKGNLLSPSDGEEAAKRFPKVKSNKMKAAYQRQDDKVVMIRGNDFWVSTYNSAKEKWIPDEGYPLNVKTLGLPKGPSSAFFDQHTDKSYFFKRTYVWRYDEYSQEVDITKGRLKKMYKGVPENPNAAFQDANGDTIFLSGTDFYRVTYGTKATSAGPENFASTFLVNC